MFKRSQTSRDIENYQNKFEVRHADVKIADNFDGSEQPSLPDGVGKEDAELAPEGKEKNDDRILIDWFEDTSIAIYTVGQLVFFFDGVRHIGSA